MDKKTRLKKLEDLYYAKEVTERFPDRYKCLDWSSKVAPLLRFNGIIYEKFTSKAESVAQNIYFSIADPFIDTMLHLVQMAIEELREDTESDHDEEHIDNGIALYVDGERIKELNSIPKGDFDLIRLIWMLDELNVCSRADCHMATIMLVRAVLDHVPPIFGCKVFAEVANNYKGQGSFRTSMEHLENSSRKIADQHLHCHVRKKEVLPNKTQVNFKNDLDVLLAEIVRILK
jgi:hypothetical protein